MFEVFDKFDRKEMWYHNVPFDYDSPKLQDLRKELMAKKPSMITDHACCYAGSVDLYIKHRDLYCQVVLYEDLQERPEETTR